MKILACWLGILADLSQDWSERVSFGNMDAYEEKFNMVSSYFEPRFEEAIRVGNEMMDTILRKTTSS